MAPFRPMLLTLAPELPAGPGVVFEPKIDGFRAVVTVRGGSIRIMSRHGVDWTEAFPEPADLAAVTKDAVLDGELAVLDASGRADFGLLQDRLGFRALARSHARRYPAVFYAFDIVRLDGTDLCREPWCGRRKLLESLDLSRAGSAGRVVPYTYDGPEMHRLTKQLRYEGTVAKRTNSRYFPGKRTKSWMKVKHARRAWMAVLGWRAPTSRSPGGLVVGEEGEPRGVAMIALPAQQRADLVELMQRYGRCHPTGMLTVPGDVMEADVSYTDSTSRGMLRHPVCRAIRHWEEATRTSRDSQF